MHLYPEQQAYPHLAQDCQMTVLNASLSVNQRILEWTNQLYSTTTFSFQFLYYSVRQVHLAEIGMAVQVSVVSTDL